MAELCFSFNIFVLVGLFDEWRVGLTGGGWLSLSYHSILEITTTLKNLQ